MENHDQTKCPNCERCISDLREDKARLEKELEEAKHTTMCYKAVLEGLEIKNIDKIPTEGMQRAWKIGETVATLVKDLIKERNEFKSQVEALEFNLRIEQ